MTAEIAILNRSAIALAADSAVTVGRNRVWKTTNKIFSLGPRNDAAIMIYGSADYMGCPWETLVKVFRDRFCKETFSTLRDMSEKFLEWLKYIHVPGENGQLHARYCFVNSLEEIRRGLSDEEIADSAKIRKKALEFERALDQRQLVDGAPSVDSLTEKYGHVIDEFSEELFGKRISKPLKKMLRNLIIRSYISTKESGYESGIVFAGYGEKEMFPAFSLHVFDGRDGELFRCWKVDELDLNTDELTTARIVPLAQQDIAVLFVEGIALSNLTFTSRIVGHLLDEKSSDLISRYILNDDERIVEAEMQRRENKKILEEFQSEFYKYRERAFITPLMDSIDSLPKEEMGALAESLVELTSLKRKFEPGVESVSGPVDVAVISKGDGVVWVKRKHYFDPRLNSDFSRRKDILNRGLSDAKGQK